MSQAATEVISESDILLTDGEVVEEEEEEVVRDVSINLQDPRARRILSKTLSSILKRLLPTNGMTTKVISDLFKDGEKMSGKIAVVSRLREEAEVNPSAFKLTPNILLFIVDIYTKIEKYQVLTDGEYLLSITKIEKFFPILFSQFFKVVYNNVNNNEPTEDQIRSLNAWIDLTLPLYYVLPLDLIYYITAIYIKKLYKSDTLLYKSLVQYFLKVPHGHATFLSISNIIKKFKGTPDRLRQLKGVDITKHAIISRMYRIIEQHLGYNQFSIGAVTFMPNYWQVLLERELQSQRFIEAFYPQEDEDQEGDMDSFFETDDYESWDDRVLLNMINMAILSKITTPHIIPLTLPKRVTVPLDQRDQTPPLSDPSRMLEDISESPEPPDALTKIRYKRMLAKKESSLKITEKDIEEFKTAEPEVAMDVDYDEMFGDEDVQAVDLAEIGREELDPIPPNVSISNVSVELLKKYAEYAEQVNAQVAYQLDNIDLKEAENKVVFLHKVMREIEKDEERRDPGTLRASELEDYAKRYFMQVQKEYNFFRGRDGKPVDKIMEEDIKYSSLNYKEYELAVVKRILIDRAYLALRYSGDKEVKDLMEETYNIPDATFILFHRLSLSAGELSVIEGNASIVFREIILIHANSRTILYVDRNTTEADINDFVDEAIDIYENYLQNLQEFHITFNFTNFFQGVVTYQDERRADMDDANANITRIERILDTAPANIRLQVTEGDYLQLIREIRTSLLQCERVLILMHNDERLNRIPIHNFIRGVIINEKPKYGELSFSDAYWYDRVTQSQTIFVELQRYGRQIYRSNNAMEERKEEWDNNTSRVSQWNAMWRLSPEDFGDVIIGEFKEDLENAISAWLLGSNYQYVQGAFYKFINCTKMNLEALGIYKEIPEKMSDSCFINAIKYSGYTDDRAINECKLIMMRGSMPQRLIQDIIDKYLNTNLRVIKWDSKKSRWRKKDFWYHKDKGNKNMGIIEILLEDEHYMPSMKMSHISKDYIKNYEDWSLIYPPNAYIDDLTTGNICIDVENLGAAPVKMHNRSIQLVDKRVHSKKIVELLCTNPETRKLVDYMDIKDDRNNYFNDELHYEKLYESSKSKDYVIDKQSQKIIEMETDEERMEYLKNVKGKTNGLKLVNISYNRKIYEVDEKAYVDPKKTLGGGVVKHEYSIYHDVVYLDVESGFDDEWVHQAFCVCYTKESTGPDVVYSFKGINCIEECFKTLQGNFIIYCHNLKYDHQFIISKLRHAPIRHGDLNVLKTDGSIYQTIGYYYNKITAVFSKFWFKDSIKIITERLSEFPSMFGLNKMKKEVIPYNHYRSNNIFTEFSEYKEAVTHLKTEEEKKEFYNNITEWGLWESVNNKGGKFKHVDYAVKYCGMDVIILKLGMKKFREWIWCLCGEDIHDRLTIPSIAHQYLINTGCYIGVKQINGVARKFIQETVIGGRVMLAENHKIDVKNEVVDYDAVSLYPTAIIREPGPLKGVPKVLTPEQCNIDFLSNECDGYFVQIRVKSVGVKLRFPVLSYKEEKSKKRIWTNEVVGKILYCDKFTLESAVKFQSVTFEVLKGLYYNNGRNNTVCSVMKKLFDERKRLKDLKNPAQIIYKLLMNASYGKTIQRAHNTKLKIVSKDKINSFIRTNWNEIKEITMVQGSNHNEVTLFNSINDHFNAPHVGSEILSKSKLIMSELMTVAECNDIPIFYQDTDSLHMLKKDVPRLQELFYEKYSRVLDGKGIGQFHSDFEADNKIDTVLHSRRFIGLGKKCYMDIKICKKKNEQKIYEENHIRMKGISMEAIYYAAEQLNISVEVLYERLYKGETMEFDLCLGGDKKKFHFKKGGGVQMKLEFLRKIAFDLTGELIINGEGGEQQQELIIEEDEEEWDFL